MTMTLYIWRHPKPLAVEGICLGQTDRGVAKRKLKRLANQIHKYTQRHHLPKVIWVSPLQRSLQVGQLLAKRGFKCHISPELMEVSFGEWDGLPWANIPWQEIDAWCEDFADYQPGNGESVRQLFTRVEQWLNQRVLANEDAPILVIGHAGWINAAKRLATGVGVPQVAADWPRSVGYGVLTVLGLP